MWSHNHMQRTTMIFPNLRILNGIYKLCCNSSPRRFYSYKNLLQLYERGFLQDHFPSTAKEQMKLLFQTDAQTIYAGFDPTANSLHVGNLLVILGLLHCQRYGHTPIALIGGATGVIGDPSHRKTERKLIDAETVENNLIAIRGQLQRIFTNHQQYLWEDRKQAKHLPQLRIVNNADWYKQLDIINFVANIGRHFRLGSMLSRSSVQARLEAAGGISFTEFTYQVFQAYDWLHLLRSYNCRFQLGGSDQMGNIMSGHELISRTEKKDVFGLTLPIITNEEGDKFGKSGGSAVWLDSTQTSTFAFYQFFIRKTDDEVENLLKLFTFLPIQEIASLMREHRKQPEKRKAQTVLAEDVTRLVHGEEGLRQAECITKALYNGDASSLGDLNYSDIKQIFAGATIAELLPEPDMTILQLAMKAKCFPTEADAIRIIAAGGFYINLKRTENVAELVSHGIHVLKNGVSLLRVGKRNFYIVRWLL